ncbi:thiamine phosphate synthase [Agrilactobacillus fermenti]|uniref:thiamine phosphate synthase n=1 Tax=Agrilactobacillus fermenti TaxID=2586909 RepID=UPI001E3D901D|nr:thiamine phosphate synthase [Agrilactobacillus fermenti]
MMKFEPDQLRAYFVCGTQDLRPEQDILELVDRVLAAGVTAFQFRDKGPHSRLTPAQRLEIGRALRQLCRRYQVPFIVDDDLALADATAADGIHVGQKDGNIKATVSQVAGRHFIGYSCETTAQIKKANTIGGIDYYGCGPIFPTQSKTDADPAFGPEGLMALIKAAKRPVVGIGGITLNNHAQLPTNAAGYAVISYLTRSQDLTADVAALLAITAK